MASKSETSMGCCTCGVARCEGAKLMPYSNRNVIVILQQKGKTRTQKLVRNKIFQHCSKLTSVNSFPNLNGCCSSPLYCSSPCGVSKSYNLCMRVEEQELASAHDLMLGARVITNGATVASAQSVTFVLLLHARHRFFHSPQFSTD